MLNKEASPCSKALQLVQQTLTIRQICQCCVTTFTLQGVVPGFLKFEALFFWVVGVIHVPV